MRRVLKWVWIGSWFLMLPLAVIGGYTLWNVSGLLRMEHDRAEIDHSLLAMTPTRGRAREALGETAVRIAVYGQPTAGSIIDNPYPLRIETLLTIGSQLLRVLGRLRAGETRDESRLPQLFVVPGQAPLLFIPVTTDTASEGWRPIELPNVEWHLALMPGERAEEHLARAVATAP